MTAGSANSVVVERRGSCDGGGLVRSSVSWAGAEHGLACLLGARWQPACWKDVPCSAETNVTFALNKSKWT